MKTIGFIGLGIMGLPMAKNLQKAGYPLNLYDISPSRGNDLVAGGARFCTSAAEAASLSDIVIIMLPNSPHVREAMFGEKGILEGIREGSTVIDMSSIAPLVSREIASVLTERKVHFLDAPVSGGEPKAIDGTLAIMVGGEEEIFSQVEEILLVMGSSTVLVGGAGSGNMAKIANQIMVAANIAGMSEAFVLASKAGVNPEKVFHAVKGGLAGSTVLNAKMPLALERKFDPGFRIDLHIKDLQNALDTAHSVSSPAFLSSSIIEMMHALRVDGKGGNDHGGLIQFYEKLAGITIS